MSQEHHHPVPDSEEKLVALLSHLCEHNESHTEELSHLADKLKEFGHEKEAAALQEAADLYTKGNEKLREALAGLR